jgi:1-acyl-sn-glycerol-3-phosphate acyltransferase
MIAWPLVGLSRLVSGARARWVGCEPHPRQRIYFANHTSHLDTLVLWSALPNLLRPLTRPVAARDYWSASFARRFLAEKIFNAVLIDRTPADPEANPVFEMARAMGHLHSLIIFPEGTRSPTGEPGAFKSGLYYLARERSDVELVPVYMENLNRILPKGSILPVPLLGSVTIGAPIRLDAEEEKSDFLARARTAVLSLHSL